MDDIPTLTERMLANTEAGFPECERPSDHHWMGSFGRNICAVCLVTTEELAERAKDSQ